jgi:ubiquinone/menaquinone biosynthesis C-methylase UbiE
VVERLVAYGDLEGRRVLDVGCGTGVLAAALAERFAAKVWGVDATEAMLEVARSRVPATVGLRRAEAEALPFRDGWFERVVARLVLHLVDRPRALGEAARVLATGGRFVTATFEPEHFDRYWLNRFFPSLLELDRARFPKPDELRLELAAAGLEPLQPERLLQHGSLSREDALERVRGRFISTLRLLPEGEFAEGLARAEAELPDRVEYELRWLLVAADQRS